VRDVLGQGLPEVPLAEGNDAIETFLFNGPDEALGVGVGIGRLKRRLHDMDSGILQHLSHVPAPLVVTITNQHAMGLNGPSVAVSVRLTCRMNRPSGCGVDPTIWTRRDARSITNTL
jgi:hypothetical protein